MTKVGKSDREGTFPGTPGKDKVAPKAVITGFTPKKSLPLSIHDLAR
jgi:hypothetical protein